MSDLEDAYQAGADAIGGRFLRPLVARETAELVIDAAIASGELVPQEKVAGMLGAAYQDADHEVERLRGEWQDDNFELNQKISRLALENERLRDAIRLHRDEVHSAMADATSYVGTAGYDRALWAVLDETKAS